MNTSTVTRFLYQFFPFISSGQTILAPNLRAREPCLLRQDLDPVDEEDKELIDMIRNVVEDDGKILWDKIIFPKITVLRVEVIHADEYGMQKETPNGVCLRDIMSFFSLLFPIDEDSWWEGFEDEFIIEEQEDAYSHDLVMYIPLLQTPPKRWRKKGKLVCKGNPLRTMSVEPEQYYLDHPEEVPEGWEIE